MQTFIDNCPGLFELGCHATGRDLDTLERWKKLRAEVEASDNEPEPKPRGSRRHRPRRRKRSRRKKGRTKS